MKEIPAYKVTLFVAGILALLLTVTFFVPDEGFDVNGHKIKFLTLQNFIQPPVQETADIEAIVSGVDTSIVDEPLTVHNKDSNGDFGAPNADELNEDAATNLQFNEAGKLNLHSFFAKLNSVAANRKKMSILHYGDSQIEGDRMTSYIRQKIQNQFGGNGPGLIPATNVYNTFAFKQSYSENFQRYTCFGGASLLLPLDLHQKLK